MLRKAPSLEAIEIFVAASQGDSFRSVARRLALSPSAVSRRIASLEAFLGMALFDRGGQTQRLTAAGQHYLAMVAPAMEAIQRASEAITQGDVRRLRIATSHSFAATWLMPRLADLHHRHGIEVEIVPTRNFDVLRSGEAHLGIWGGLTVPEDMIADTVVAANVVPISSPHMANGKGRPNCDEAFAGHTLLSVRDPAGLWERWFAAFQQTQPASFVVREFATLQLMYEAAASGAGVALAVPLVSEPWLRAGKLIPCSRRSLALGETYRLYRPIRRVARTDAEHRFADWLHGEVENSLVEFKAMTKQSMLVPSAQQIRA